MPPKKAAAKGGGDDEAAEKVHILNFKVKALEQKLVLEQERADRAKASENELRVRLLDLDGDFQKEQEKLFSISSDMTRQYKQMQDQLSKEIQSLKNLVEEKDKIIEGKNEFIEQLNIQNDYKLKKKDDEVNDLKRKIEEMSTEFAKMLHDTLDKMQERIELAQWDNETDPQMMKRLKDIAGLNHN